MLGKVQVEMKRMMKKGQNGVRTCENSNVKNSSNYEEMFYIPLNKANLFGLFKCKTATPKIISDISISICTLITPTRLNKELALK